MCNFVVCTSNKLISHKNYRNRNVSQIVVLFGEGSRFDYEKAHNIIFEITKFMLNNHLNKDKR